MKHKIIDGRSLVVCDGCEEPFTTINTNPDAVAGYVSPDSPEYRPAAIEGIPGTENVPRNVCKFCYRADWAKMYPTIECPI